MRQTSDALHPTRFPELGYCNDAPGLWRFYYLGDAKPSCVGPQYRTRAELLADLERYAEGWGLK